jgi:RND family efflux transporter MFP subunit
MLRFGVAASAASLGVLAVLAQGNLPVATTGDQVQIKREASRVIDPHKFRVPLSIEAIQTVTLVAPFDGKIKQILLKTNSKGAAQAEVIRLDNTLQKLQLDRAQKLLKVATIKLKQADKDEAATALAQAEVDLAKVDVEIAQSVVDETGIRMPFAGEIQRILVTEGQFVRAGDPVAVVADTSKMKAEIPVDRASADIGKLFGFKIEANEVEGKIEQVLPLPAKFDGLRDLFDSVASVLVVVDNADHRYKVGQTVYVPLIPRQPVVEVPNGAIGNLSDGHRKVQVVRQFIVRDISVAILGQVGSSRVFVSGPFAEGDEIIYEASHQLGDGFQLKPSTGTASTGSAGGNSGGTTSPSNSPPAKQVGF